ncbi:MAG: c-type cytochrome [Anderseniella sp.]
MKRILAAGIMAGGVAAAAGWVLAAPDPLPVSALTPHTASIDNGKRLYTAAGCLSCHLPAKDDKQADMSLPSGGRLLKTPAGSFYPPNITPDATTGIGGWTDIQFINAVKRGISPDGRHYLPAFPYTSYSRMSDADVLDIKAYMDTLKPVQAENRAAELPLGLPVETVMRRGLGIWKLASGFEPAEFIADASKDDVWNKGAYLVQGPGHCAECHTPRDWAMALDTSRWMAGGPHPEGEGKVPSLRSLKSRGRFKDPKDLATALEFGETLGYDKMSSGGMAAVQTNMSKLPAEDRTAIATYLMSLE